MGRNASWVFVAVCLAVGAGSWLYRSERAAHADVHSAEDLVRGAWTEGAHVALKGRKRIQMTTAAKPVDADVLSAQTGNMRIQYVTEPLKGATVWEDGETTYRYNPRLKRLTVAHRRKSPSTLAQQEAQLIRNYEMRVIGAETVAGRHTVEVELKPKNRTQRWKHIWIDPVTSVILATEDHNERGVMRRTRYLSVEYLDSGHQPDPATFHPSEELIHRYRTAKVGDASSRYEAAQLSKLVGFPVREPAWLPRGFVLQGAYKTPCLCASQQQGARLEYSDGLSAISLFECDSPDCPEPAEAPTKEISTALTYRYVHDGVNYLAVGDASQPDLERLVHSAAAAAH